jgi:hypothetical protein
MPTIGIIAGIGFGAYSAYKQSKASDQAAQQQQQSGQAALDLEKQIYQQNQANLQPYMALGGGAATSLRQLMGLPSTGGAAGQLPPGSYATGTGYTVNPQTGGVTITDLGTSVYNQNNPLAGTGQMFGGQGAFTGQDAAKYYGSQIVRSALGQGPSMASIQGLLQGQQPAATGRTVTMRAPDGTIEQVPASQVAHFQTLGAVVVG